MELLLNTVIFKALTFNYGKKCIVWGTSEHTSVFRKPFWNGIR